MRNDVNRRWLLASRPAGVVGEENFRWSEEPIPVPGEGQVLVRNLWLSFDPTQRNWMARDTYVPMVRIGEPMRAASIGQVIESRHPGYKAGDLVRGAFGWQDYTVTDGSGFLGLSKLAPGVLPNVALNLFAATGLAAYFGMLEVGQPKPGETVVVSGAAGATGSIAGQIAKLKGCRVIGTAGGKLKCDWLTTEAGFDGAIDYRSEDLPARLGELCPDGIDVFFDNVGGPVLNEVLARLRSKARIALCGAISRYNDATLQPGPSNYFNLVASGSRMEGFLVFQYAGRFAEASIVLAGWLRDGLLKHKEDIEIGLEKAPKTLAKLFTGENFGKQLLKIADPPLQPG
jgi:NADPH-dependent curcumin reductase CurA